MFSGAQIILPKINPSIHLDHTNLFYEAFKMTNTKILFWTAFKVLQFLWSYLLGSTVVISIDCKRLNTGIRKRSVNYLRFHTIFLVRLCDF